MKTFRQNEIPDLNFNKAIKRPIPVRCIQINEDFEVHTLEGIMKGKKGDWLFVGVSGEMYPCDNKIFELTYDLVQ